MKKNHKIQILRAIAIIAVVMIHTCPIGISQVLVRPLINFSVGTFLFLSGYLTDTSNIDTKQFYKKRIIRVIIPYTIWTILYTTLSFYPDGIDIKRYFHNFVTSDGAATLYYILVYIQFVLLTPLLNKLLHKKYWFIGFIITPISLLINYYWLISGASPNKYLSLVWHIGCLGWFTYYYLGLYLKNVIDGKKFNINKLIIIYIITIFIQIMEGYIWYKLGEVNCGTQLKLSSLLTTTVFVLLAYSYINSTKFNNSNKILSLIGDYSFGIYISHLMIINILYKTPFYKFIPFFINSILVLSLTLLLVIIGKKILGKKISKYFGLY